MKRDFKGKKLLILGGASIHNKVVRAAKEMGIYTIVTDYLPDSPGKKLADESWMNSITDVDGIVSRCKKEKVDAVLNFCIDPAQVPYQAICERLNLPCYANKEQFNIMTDKRNFKAFCSKNNVDTILDYTEEDIKKNKASYPLFIKPTNSRGSRGQSICHTQEEALKGIEFAKNESRDNSFICEKYMQGCQDLATAYFVVDGEPYLVKFGNRHMGKKEDHLETQVVCTELPSEFSNIYIKNIDNRVKNMIKAIGIKFGPVFLQGFIDGETIRYYDPALRMPGGDYDLILKEATGFDTVKSLINFAFTGDTKFVYGNPENAYNLSGGKALMLSISVRPGLISKVTGFADIGKNENVVYTRQIIPEGSIIKATGDVKQRVAAIGAYFPNGEKVNQFVKIAYDKYKVLDENGEDMIISKYEC